MTEIRTMTSERFEALTKALLELRELAPSGSLEMGIIDEALKKIGLRPWLAQEGDGMRDTGSSIDDAPRRKD
jgi:hypothetical protein